MLWPLCALGMHAVHRHAFKQNTHTHMMMMVMVIAMVVVVLLVMLMVVMMIWSRLIHLVRTVPNNADKILIPAKNVAKLFCFAVSLKCILL